MIDDAERRRLAAIEDMLRTEDLGFVHRFGTQPHRRGSLRTGLAVLALIAAVTVTVAALRYRSVPTAVLGLIGVGASAGIGITSWIGARDGSSKPDQPAPP